MPLSEHEQRMLDEIESGLYADDPKFASNVRRSSSSSGISPNLWKFVLVGLVGLALLIVGLAFGPKPAGFPIVSLLGFVIMFGAGVGALLSTSGSTEKKGASSPGRGKAAPKKGSRGQNGPASKSKPSGNFSDRMEERFRRRFEEGR
ncbi:DUF3040 domain-containing protein [Dietzia timorensis]|uniref:Transmembrane protein n=1 Tax=Dietzia timorensis TaxID=499555 RepID=A0A173LKL2_9ACTN|nr:DUF3040 domain-containing protein [Dietzia timorensis]ANI92154.1 Hypothetical protein BJL86_1372 [Dietzia timorensis]